MTTARESLSDQVRAAGYRLGFDAVGIARADVSLDRDVAHYDAFVREGRHGEMSWLARNRPARERLDGEAVLRGARSVVCVARRYQPAEERLEGEVVRTIARYARGRDYHRFLRRRIRRLATFVRSLGSAESPVRARPLCDEEPILERAWAARAGLGFVGKNGMLILPGLGSMALLGEVVTTLQLDPSPAMSGATSANQQERCGTCRLCLDACPTQAFSRPFVLDARRCVSYLTIEHRSAIPLELRAGVGSHLFGCDDCQTVCPYNAAIAARAPLDRSDGDPFVPLERWSRATIESMLSLDDEAWRALSEGSPLKRARRSGLARNAAIVLGNRGDQGALPALRSTARNHGDSVVREAAAWAVSRIELSRAANAP